MSDYDKNQSSDGQLPETPHPHGEVSAPRNPYGSPTHAKHAEPIPLNESSTTQDQITQDFPAQPHPTQEYPTQEYTAVQYPTPGSAAPQDVAGQNTVPHEYPAGQNTVPHEYPAGQYGNYQAQSSYASPVGGHENKYSDNSSQGQSFGLVPAVSAPPFPVSSSHSSRDRKRPSWGGIVGVAALVGVLAGGGSAYAVTQMNHETDASSAVSVLDAKSTVSSPVSNSGTSAPQWQNISASIGKTVVAIYMTGTDPDTGSSGQGNGTGVVIDKTGHIITNSHVATAFGASTKLQVVLDDGRAFDAKLVGDDPSTDLAVIKIDTPPADLSPATLGNSSSVKVGDPVMAIGTPLDLRNTFTTGIVSALHRPNSAMDGSYTSAVQTDAAINPGNSGGPLVNAAGEVIGINSTIASLQSTDERSGSIGLGFSIPIDTVKMISKQLIEKGKAEHTYLGVNVATATADLDNGASMLGAGIGSVEADSPASRAGINKGDVITAVDGVPVSQSIGLNAEIRSHAVGSTITVSIVRDKKVVDLKVTLTSAPESANK